MNVEMAIAERSGISFNAFRQVWTFEQQDIKEFLSGSHGDSSRYHAKKVGERLGVSKEAALAGLSLIPGGTAAALVAQIAVGLPDFLKGNELDERAAATRQMLQLEGLPTEDLDWDYVEEAVRNIGEWLLPRIRGRSQLLTDLATAAPGNTEIEGRQSLYVRAIQELTSARDVLNRRLQQLQVRYKERFKDHHIFEGEQSYRLQKELSAIEVGVEALLWDRDTADIKRRSVEGAYQALRCQHTKLLKRCERLGSEGLSYCPDHVCAKAGCSAVRVDGSHFCSVHSPITSRNIARLKQLQKHDSLLEADQSTSVRTGGASSECVRDDHPRRSGLYIVAAAVVLFGCGAAYFAFRGAPTSEGRVSEQSFDSRHAQPEVETSTVPLLAKPSAPASEADVVATTSGRVLAGYEQMHGEKPSSDWTEEDMARAVDLLASAKGAELAEVIRAENEVLTYDCGTGACFIAQREFLAAKRLREGKVKTVQDALRIAD